MNHTNLRANSGIGKAAATQIAQQGYHTILACRHPDCVVEIEATAVV